MTRLLIVGPPGSGKGTQAQQLSFQLSIPHISTGDIFRKHVVEQTPLGELAQRHLNRGDLVPDSVTNDMVRQRLGMPDAQDGFLLDGFPRTLAQAKALDEMLASNGIHLNAVIELTVTDDDVIQRLLAREDGRSDDNDDVIRHRLETYHEQTNDVIAHYAHGRLVASVDGLGQVQSVTQRIIAALPMASIPSSR